MIYIPSLHHYMRNSQKALATPLTACFVLSHIGYSHVSYVEINHELEIDIETKIKCISSPRLIFQQRVSLKNYSFSTNVTHLWKRFSNVWKFVVYLYTRSSKIIKVFSGFGILLRIPLIYCWMSITQPWSFPLLCSLETQKSYFQWLPM